MGPSISETLGVLFARNPQPMWVYDRGTLRFLAVNDATIAHYGYSRDEFLSMSLRDIRPPEDLARLRDHVAQLGQAPSVATVWRHRRSDGSLIDVEVSSYGLELQGRQVQVAHINDVTERRRADAALRTERAYLRRLFQEAPEGVILVDGEDHILNANVEFLRMFGFRAEEVVGRRTVDLIVPPGSEAEGLSFTRRAHEGSRVRTEATRRRKDGSLLSVSILATPVDAEEGRGEVYGIYRDISEQKAAADAVQEREEYFRSLIENAQDLITVLEADGAIRYESPSITRILGYEMHELLGQNAFDNIHPEDVPLLRAKFRRAMLRPGTPVEVEFRTRHSDGSWRLLSATGASLLEHPAVRGIIVNSRDVTEERAREERLRRTERLASLGTLIGGVAHELNNPLAAIKSFAELLRMDACVEEDREALEVIGREAGRAAKIVASLRLLARQTQESSARRERVDLNEIVRHVLKLRRYTLETHNVQVVEELAPDLAPVLGIRGELEQVVLNLVVNAEYALAGQTEPRVLTLRTRTSAHGCVLQVMDTGAGIAEMQLERIFDPFFTTKPPGEGTGLGLSLVHQIITEHGGEVRVTSELGRQTHFRIVLPAAPARTQRPPRLRSGQPQAAADGRPLDILVVDDEESIRRSLQRFFSRRGHRVQIASEGGEALGMIDAAAAPGYDVILSDLRMPGLDGEQLLQALAERGGGLEGRLIFMSGDSASSGAERAFATASVPVVAKPFDLVTLAELVEQHAAACTAR